MLSRLLCLLLLFELFTCLIMGVGLVHQAGWSTSAALLFILFLMTVGRAAPIAFSYLYRHAHAVAKGTSGTTGAGGASRLSVDALWRQALSEWWALCRLLLACTFEALLMGADLPRRRAVDGGQRCDPVLLVHGYACNRGAWWWLKPRLEAHGRQVATLTLEPLWGDIDGYAEQIARRIAWLRRETGAARVTLVGYSMGGLACLAYLRRYGEDNVAKLITLATPHSGSGPLRLGLGRNVEQMSAHSPWLVELARFFEEMPLVIPCVAFYCPHDNLLIPPATAMLRGADNRALAEEGHFGILVSPAVLKALLAVTADG